MTQREDRSNNSSFGGENEGRDGIRNALQAEFEAETDYSFTLRDTKGMTDLDFSENERSRNLGGTDEITQSGAELPMNDTPDVYGGENQTMRVNTGNQDDDGDGRPLAAKDGLRYDYDDSSDV